MRDEAQCVTQKGVGEDTQKQEGEEQGMPSHGFAFLYYGRATSPLSLPLSPPPFLSFLVTSVCMRSSFFSS